jgi:selenocysteine lyase/cysteine desulfurase
MTAPETSYPFEMLEQGVYAALETYSNVHRGSGQYSTVTTHLYEKARGIILDILKLDKRKYVVIFCTPDRANMLISKLKHGSFHCLSSADINLPLGVRAIAIARRSLPMGIPFHKGGGTARLVSRDWVLWSGAPGKFEAGTPSIINVIAFTRALILIHSHNNKAFFADKQEKLPVSDVLNDDQTDNYSGIELLEKLKETFIGRGIPVPTSEGLKPYINLDNAASTPSPLPVWNTVCRIWRQPEDIYGEIADKVKTICADILGVSQENYKIIFTSNTTESINLAAENIQANSEKEIEPVIINTIIEHNSNDLPWRFIPGCSMIRLEADSEGFLDTTELERILDEYNNRHLHGKKRIKLMAVSGGSNVLGVFNNIDEISRIAHKYDALLLVDAAQVVAHRTIEMEKSGIDILAFSAHKAYAPFGTGILAIRKNLITLSDERMTEICSSGEENVTGIAALGKALTLLQRIGIDNITCEEQKLTAQALKGLSEIEGLTIYGIKDPDSPSFRHKGGVILVNMKGLMANGLSKQLAELGGIGTRSGCHCAHILIKRLVKIGPKLEKFQKIMVTTFPGIKLPGLLRISLGIENSKEDINELLIALEKIARKDKTSGYKHLRHEMNNFIKAVEHKVY